MGLWENIMGFIVAFNVVSDFVLNNSKILRRFKFLTKANVQAFLKKFDLQFQWFFGVVLRVLAFIIFGLGTALLFSEHLLGASKERLILLALCFVIEAGLFYWMAPEIPNLNNHLRFTPKLKA